MNLTTLQTPSSNNTDFIVDRILLGTYTYTDALRRVRTLKQYLLNQVFASALKNFSAESEADNAWLSGLGAEVFSLFTQQNIYLLSDQIEQSIKKITPLIIYLPFEIPQGEVVRVGMKLRQDYGKHFLVEFRIDPNLIAGPAFVWNSIYKDYSVRSRIEQNRQQILDIIKGYLEKGRSTSHG